MSQPQALQHLLQAPRCRVRWPLEALQALHALPAPRVAAPLATQSLLAQLDRYRAGLDFPTHFGNRNGCNGCNASAGGELRNESGACGSLRPTATRSPDILISGLSGGTPMNELCVECDQNPRAGAGSLSRDLNCIRAAAQRFRDDRARHGPTAEQSLRGSLR